MFIYRCDLCGTDFDQGDDYGLEHFQITCENCGSNGCDICVSGGLCDFCHSAMDDEDDLEDEDDDETVED